MLKIYTSEKQNALLYSRQPKREGRVGFDTTSYELGARRKDIASVIAR